MIKLFRAFVSKSINVFFSKSLIGRLVSTGLATLVMTAITLVFTSYKENRQVKLSESEIIEAAAAEAVEPPPQGLSRQRQDFEKALNILSDAADKNGDLKDYFKRVSKRVKGEQASPEKGSGVRVLKVARKKASAATSNGAESIEAKNSTADLKDYAQTAMMASPETTASSSSAQADSAAADVEYDNGRLENKLAVGDMAFEVNPAIERWVNYYTATQGGRTTMTIGLRRSQGYIDMARKEFSRAGVPEDLIWLALVESVWNPTAVSPAAAGGLWQFIPKTAMEYGLSVQQGNDERNDPVKQTRVAAEYLRDLYTIFGDWTLAMAAYNSGEPRVMDAIVKNGRANFWELYEKQLLPKETRDYVPKILAAIKVVSQPEIYGYNIGSDSGPGSQTEVVFSGH